MNKKILLQTLVVVALGFTLLFGISFVIDQNQERADTRQPTQEQEAEITLTIEGLYLNKEVSITAGDTVLEVLEILDAEDPDLALITKEYEGLGVLVESIGGTTNGMNDEYWQYVVNGEMPQVGAGDYQLSQGDSVTWYFGESEY